MAGGCEFVRLSRQQQQQPSQGAGFAAWLSLTGHMCDLQTKMCGQEQHHWGALMSTLCYL
jgi:hypothetical protein